MGQMPNHKTSMVKHQTNKTKAKSAQQLSSKGCDLTRGDLGHDDVAVLCAGGHFRTGF